MNLAYLSAIPDGGPLPRPWKDHLSELAEQLDSFHREIAQGIIDIRIPSHDNVTIDLDPLKFPPRSLFEAVGSPFGAGFVYSNRHVVDVYPLDEDLPNRLPGHVSDEQYALFLARFKLGSMARRKALYILLNLHETWQTIQHLRTLAQLSPDVSEPFNGWSVGEIAKALEDSFPRDPSEFQEVSVSRDVMSNLRKLVVPNIEGDLGLRALLSRVTP